MRFIPYSIRAIELSRSEPYAIQFEFSALAITQNSPFLSPAELPDTSFTRSISNPEVKSDQI